jgi:hypothetical protein
MTWILVLFVHYGPLASGYSNAITSVPGFQSQEACVAAAKESQKLVAGTVKSLNSICVKDR